MAKRNMPPLQPVLRIALDLLAHSTAQLFPLLEYKHILPIQHGQLELTAFVYVAQRSPL